MTARTRRTGPGMGVMRHDALTDGAEEDAGMDGERSMEEIEAITIFSMIPRDIVPHLPDHFGTEAIF